MLLAIDVGNTNIVLGVMDGETLVVSGRLSTNIYQTDEEYAMKLKAFLSLHEVERIDGAIISSVVPALNTALKNAVRIVTGAKALIVGPGVKTGLSIKIDDPAQLGADLVQLALHGFVDGHAVGAGELDLVFLLARGVDAVRLCSG